MQYLRIPLKNPALRESVDFLIKSAENETIDDVRVLFYTRDKKRRTHFKEHYS